MTSATITDSEISALRDAAGQAGDMATCRLADIALGDTDPEELAELIADTGTGYDVTAAELAAMTPAQARELLAAHQAEARAQLGD